MSALDLDRKPKPQRPDCSSCGATDRGCASTVWLRGRTCCEACEHTAREEAAQ